MKNFVNTKCGTLWFADQGSNFRSVLYVVEADFSVLEQNVSYFLHPQEVASLKEFSSEKRKHSYLLGRYAAKQALIQYNTSIFPTDILVKPGVFQQPIAYLPTEERLQLTLSHCDQRGVALTFPEAYLMGIDLEVIDPKYNEEIKMHLTTQEKNILKAASNPFSEMYCMIFWTAREALSKALRTGFMSPFEVYEIEEIKMEKGCWVSKFKNFPQFQGRSFCFGNLIFSLVYPKNVHLMSNSFLNAETNNAVA
jgi:4'-phosphopantetheinyl transferase EntD